MESYYFHLTLSSICLSVFYMAYLIFFRKEQNFRLARIYLLSAILFSLMLPLNPFKIYLPVLKFEKPLPENKEPKNNSAFQATSKNDETIVIKLNDTFNVSKPAPDFNYKSLIVNIYFILMILILARMFFSIFKLIYLYSTCAKIKNQDHTIILIDKRIIAFSFFHWIFVDKLSSGNDLAQIIKHEKIHAQQYHSIDLLLSELLVATMWFNPFAWLIKKSLGQLHEFLADEGVLDSGYNKLEYQTLLVNQAAEERLVAVSSNFSYSLIKKRIMMMSKTKKQGNYRIKLLSLISITTLLFIAISCSNAQKNDGIKVESMPISPEYITAVSPTKMNVLYIGVDNPVSIAVTNARNGKITAEIDNGTITGENGQYVVRLNKVGLANITIKVDGKIAGKSTFRVKMVPDPVAIIAGNWNKQIFTKQELITAGGIEVILPNFDFDLKFEVVGFSLSAIDNGFERTKKSDGNKFSKEQIEAINSTKPGGKIYVEDIKAKGPDGSTRILGTLALKLQ